MPTYEYACKKCAEHLEVVQSFKDDPLTKCPNCGGALRKVFGNVGISFKGSGFYKTDSRSGSKTSSSSESKTDTKADTKTDTKTAAPGTSTSGDSSSSSQPAAAGAAS